MNNISLKYRIALIILMLEAVMVTVVLWRVETVAYDEVTSTLHTQHGIYMDLLTDLGRNALVTSEYGELQHYVDKFGKISTINSIFITDHRNVIVVSSEHDLLSKPLPTCEDDERGHWDHRNIALESGAGNLGSIHIKLSNSPIRAAHRKSIIHGISVAGLSMVVIAVAGLMIGHLIVRRLEKLNDAARKISDGHLDTQADISGSDEVAKLCQAFNVMAQKIQASMDFLHESEKSLREAQHIAHLGSWQWTVATDTVQWSEELYHINGRAPKLPPPCYAEMASCYTPESWQRLSEAVAQALQSGESYELDLEIVRPDGTTRHTAAKGEALYNAKGKVVQLQGTVQDITERKLVEEVLREREHEIAEALEFNKSILRTSSIGILTYDAAGQCIFINEAAAEIIGTDAAGLLSQNFNQIPSWEKSGMYEAALRALNTGIEQHIEVQFRTTFGKDLWVSVRFSSFLSRGEKQLLLFIYDIAPRKQAEERLTRSLREKEVLLKEVHHRVKNNMQVIISLLNLQAKGITDNTVRALFEESQNRVRSMALIHEGLYQSEDLAFIDFKEYLQRLIAGIAETQHRREVTLVVDMESLTLDVNQGVPCGLIVNELVSNSFKHAFPDGREGVIRLGIGKNSEGNNVLTVEDNGIGFPAEVDFRNTSSLGLQLVNALTGQLNGTVELLKREGTRFSITFPGRAENAS